MNTEQQSAYSMPAAVPAPNLGRVFSPPPPGSRVRHRLLNVLSAANVWLYRLSGGRVGGRMGRAPVLLLHHVGRRSGTQRVVPLLFLAEGRRLVIVASKAGSVEHPAWYRNLMTKPETVVEVGSRRIRVRAREASAAERAAYWPRLVELYPSYDLYRQRTDRVLPVVVLEPGDESAGT